MNDLDILDVSCTFCGAGRGIRCVDTRTNRPTKNPHPSRIRDANWHSIGEHEDEMPEDRYDRK